MRSYGRIETGYWQNPKTVALSDPAKLLQFYLFACPHGNSIGCFPLPPVYIAADMHWPAVKVDKYMAELRANNFVEVDERTNRVRIVGWFGHNQPENGNTARGMVNAWKQLPAGEMRDAVMAEMLALQNKHLTPAAEPFRTLPNASEQVGKSFQPVEPIEPEPEPEPIAAAHADAPAAVSEISARVFTEIGFGCEATILNTGRIGTWLGKGYDPDLDILPAIRDRLRKKRKTEPEFVPRGLDYFDGAVADAQANRLKPMPKGQVNGAGRGHAQPSTDGFAQLARNIAVERGFGRDDDPDL